MRLTLPAAALTLIVPGMVTAPTARNSAGAAAPVVEVYKSPT